VARITDNPFTSGIGGAAEIFPQKHGGTLPELSPGLLHKIDFSLYILNRLLVKQMAV
jgi:hypothetical protein